MGEDEILTWLAGRFPDCGDDAAVLTPPSGTELITTSDMLLDGVHFISSQISMRRIGRKCMAVNLSDIAAMGGIPLWAQVSLALPKGKAVGDIYSLIEGMADLAAEFEARIVGGDTNTWEGPLAVNVTIIGHTATGGPILRDGARAGDHVFVTGKLGGSLAGHHLDFMPRIREAQRLVDNIDIHAMLDLSDGLSTDGWRLCQRSRCGLVVEEPRLPVSEAARETSNPLHAALHDGEDFELLFTTDEQGRALLESEWGRRFPCLLTRIGRICDEPGMWVIDGVGEKKPLQAAGYLHRLV